MSFGPEKLQQNFDALVGAVIKAKPAAAKGQYIRSCVIASTMGPGIKVSNRQVLISYVAIPSEPPVPRVFCV